MEKSQIASRIREHRQKNGLSQEVLAERSGISHRTVQRIENGESHPNGDTIKRLAAALNMTPNDLIDWAIKEDIKFLSTLNLASLSFLAFPLLGLLVPFIMWTSQKDKIKDVSWVGSQLINFQINWLILFVAVPFLLYLAGSMGLLAPLSMKDLFTSILIMYALNVFFILFNTWRVNDNKKVIYPSIISFLR